jgi:16S rRNA (guanine(527)-N(7))-methyltransferase RsmG
MSPRSRGSRDNHEKIASDVSAQVARWLRETDLRLRSDFLDKIEKMAATLALWGARTNLTANASDPAEIAFHVIDSLAPIAYASGVERAALEAALAHGARAFDLGSGAGFPGLVLAAGYKAEFTLAEARRKRASYLQVAAHELNLMNVGIEPRRASPQNVGGDFDLVTSRAFGTSTELYEIAAAALRPGGLLLLYASSDQALELSLSQAQQISFADPMTWSYQVPGAEVPRMRKSVLWRRTRAKPVGARNTIISVI